VKFPWKVHENLQQPRSPHLPTQLVKTNLLVLPKFSQSTITTLSHSMVPVWLEKFVSLVEGGASLVGPVSSCEIDTHVQSWMQLFTAEIAQIMELHMFATCTPGMSWSDAVALSEVGASTDVLGKGFAIASLHPHFPLFTEHHRDALRYGVAEIREKLFDCSNPLIGEGYAATEAVLSDLVFSKYGGEIWRQKLISPQLESDIKFWTYFKFPSAPHDCALEQVYTRKGIQREDSGGDV
jgi:hypothetical protein